MLTIIIWITWSKGTNFFRVLTLGFFMSHYRRLTVDWLLKILEKYQIFFWCDRKRRHLYINVEIQRFTVQIWHKIGGRLRLAETTPLFRLSPSPVASLVRGKTFGAQWILNGLPHRSWCEAQCKYRARIATTKMWSYTTYSSNQSI